MEPKLKHLEMIQAVVSRMASNSFLIKGWCITLVSALLALTLQGVKLEYVLVSFLPVLMFWFLDAYFLRQERLFRKLYDKIRVTPENSIDFSMNTLEFVKDTPSWVRVGFSRTLLLFYGTLVVVASLAAIIVLAL